MTSDCHVRICGSPELRCSGLPDHATSQAARFLGYEIRALHADTKITDGRRSINGAPGLFVPEQVIRTKSALYKKKGKPAPRGVLLHDEDFSIVAKFQASTGVSSSTTSSPRTCTV
jgi:hypothetical protein